MDKLKQKCYCVLFLITFIIALPFVLVTLIGGWVLYKIFELWSELVWRIKDDDVVEAWNDMLSAMRITTETIDEFVLDYKIEL